MRVLIADDQPETRQALRTIVNAQPGFTVVGEALDGRDAVALVQRRRPDLVLMDVRMPRLDGIAATREIRARPQPPAVIVLTTFDLDDYVFGALQAGAAGFLLKSAGPAQIQAALQAVRAGNAILAPDVTGRLIDRFAAISPARPHDPALQLLSAREQDVLLLLARGLSNADIAAELVLQESTVKSHVGQVLAKLGLSSRVQAVIYAYETGLTTPGRR